jgi:hypothetical protein
MSKKIKQAAHSENKYSQRDSKSEGLTISKTVSQSRSKAWQNNEKDAEAYREYMNEQAEKAAEIEDKQNGLFFIYSCFIFFMGFAWTLPQTHASILVFSLSSYGAYHALNLRAARTPLAAGAKGDKCGK